MLHTSRVALCALLLAPLAGCSSTTSFVHSDTALGRVVVYRNGVAYFERSARIEGDSLNLSVPADKVDDFLKSLTVIDAKTGDPAPIAFPTQPPASSSGLIDMKISLQGPAPHDVRLSYVTDAPSWKPSYRVVLGDAGKVAIEAWAIVDNTSGEDWQSVRLGVGSSSALSFRYDLRSIRLVQRETLRSDDLFAQAPPMGEAGYQQGQPGSSERVVAEFSDDLLAGNFGADGADKEKDEAPRKAGKKPASRPAPVAQNYRGGGKGAGAAAPTMDMSEAYGGVAGVPPQGSVAQAPAVAQMDAMNRALQTTKNQIVVEGYADRGDGDKYAASLERANRAREQLIRNGIDPNRVVAVGKGEQSGRAGGVRVVEEPPAPAPQQQAAKTGESGKEPQPVEPIGTSHFESTTAMTVPRGTSAMVSILKAETAGEVVYLYDSESARGNSAFPFRSVRLKNPTDSVLESGPFTFFGHGKFIGEGLSEPIPARSIAFVPFALDRQIQVEKKESDSDKIERIITVQRGVFSTQVQHTKKTVLVLRNRMDEAATVYVRHTVAEGYELAKTSKPTERLGSAHLFRAEVPGKGEVSVVIEETTPLFKTTDVRVPAGMELVTAYISAAAVEGPLKAQVDDLLKLQRDMANIEQRIATTREQMEEYRARMDELHAQIVTLRLVKTAGPLMQNLEKKLSEVTDKLSKATIDVVTAQEQLMVARIRFQDGVADLSLEKKAEPPKG